MADEVKKLSGEARVDALVLFLKAKHGFDVGPEILADSEDNEDARRIAGLPEKGEPKFKDGAKVHFSESSGNDQSQVYTVKSSEFKQDNWFYVVEDENGNEVSEFVESSLTAVDSEPEKS